MTEQPLAHNIVTDIEPAAPTRARGFDRRHLPAKSLALLIEHAPCCLLSVAAASLGLPFFNHNPVLEFAFALAGAVAGEWIGHRFILKAHLHSHPHGLLRRYGLALGIGLATWALHQVFVHGHF